MKSHGTQINIIAAPAQRTSEQERERGVDGGSFFKFHTQKTTSLRLQLELKTRSIVDDEAEAPVTLRVAARASQIKCKNRSIKQSIESLQSLWQMKRFSSLRAAPRRDQWESRFAGITINKFNILSADSIFVFAISAEFFLLYTEKMICLVWLFLSFFHVVYFLHSA